MNEYSESKPVNIYFFYLIVLITCAIISVISDKKIANLENQVAQKDSLLKDCAYNHGITDSMFYIWRDSTHLRIMFKIWYKKKSSRSI